ncbi:MAG TPA: DUF2142 domain-containing protein [bacterium]|nr:DUF2142 domain-containing protein [bacterium]HNT66740.1 DUF2142 domain-containing protein [bacterium]HOX85111.1 DUF2142 domain-containing protein [bacterium]HPG47034.1 DUF2142 domain-containing protein [bacterium]HPM99378.1 DUF2142 domain-containing protein [bacterium]
MADRKTDCPQVWGTRIHNCLTPPRLFLFFGIIFGMVWSIITPPFQAPDEDRHFCRAYQLSEGRFFPVDFDNTQGDSLPISAIETIEQVNPGMRYDSWGARQELTRVWHYLSLPLEPEKKAFHAFPTHVIYPPLAYLPQIIGIFIGKSCGASPLLLMYFSRWCNLIFWLIMIHAALRLMPAGRWILLIVALMPMSLFLGASLNQDAVINSLVFLALAFVLNRARTPGRLAHQDLLVIALLLMALACSKPGYAIFSLIFLLLPVDKMPSRRFYIPTALFLFTSGYGLALFWNRLIRANLNWFEPFASYPDQLQLVLHNPLQFLKAVAFSLWNYKGFYLRSHIGQLGWLDTVLPRHVILTYLFMLVGVAVLERGATVSGRQKGIMALIIAGLTLQTLLALYLVCSPVGSLQVVGMQGRYLIPVAPMFWLLWQNRRVGRPNFAWNTAAKPAIVLTLLLTLAETTRVLLQRYY